MVTNSGQRKLEDLALSETGFVFDPYTGSTFSANRTALTLLRWLQEGGLDREALIDRLRETFDTGDTDLERDLDEFVHILRQNGILSEDFEL